MPRLSEQLNPLAVSREKRPGMYADGRGLYLQVKPSTSAKPDQPPIKSWVYRFMLNGKARSMGLGPLDDVTLAQARAKAAECRALTRNGADPLKARQERVAAQRLNAAKMVTFKQAAGEYIEENKAGWRNEKHAAQWSSTLATYAEPIIGKLAVQDVDTQLVLQVLRQEVRDADGGSQGTLWTARTETATRLRGRIEAILDWGTVQGYRVGENPARWRGHLANALPKPDKVSKVEHHAALPYDKIAAFLGELRSQKGTAAKAMEFLILTAARTGEVIGATWAEISIEKALWTVPAARIKAGREHRVPLSAAALAIVEAQKVARNGDYVFSGLTVGEPLSNMAMLALLRRMDRDDLTTHGFRSTFRDWCSELTNYPTEMAEMALAHMVGDKVEQAYRRGDLFEKRRRLMDDWADFCAAQKPAGKVVAIRARRWPHR